MDGQGANLARNPRLHLTPERALLRLDAGERDTILLAQELRADLLVMDDWDGREAAEQQAFTVLGTLGVLAAGGVTLPSSHYRKHSRAYRRQIFG